MQARKSPAAARTALADGELRTLLIEDIDRGWRAFIDQYTPMLLAFIERAGIRDRDEAMELYVLVCDHLAADDCAHLRRHDPAKGALGAWLSVLVRNVTIDWVRSRAGRRRLFRSIKRLAPLDQRVFELFYWENRNVAEMVGVLEVEFGAPSLAEVLDALERVQLALTVRQRIELLAMTTRSSVAVSLDAPDDPDERPYDVPDPAADPQRDVEARETQELLDAALAALPAEDAAIIRMKYEEGFSLKQIRDALHLDTLTEQRVSAILATLQARLPGRPALAEKTTGARP